MVEDEPIACTLTTGAFTDRLAAIAQLARDALRGCVQDDLVLQLRYAPSALERVREMVRLESECCAFLAFDLEEADDEVRLTITAPERARETADLLFAQFTSPRAAAITPAPD